MHIEWLTRTIFIERADLVQIQASPTEIWQLDIPAFRLFLKDQEDNEDGMVNPSTHTHNTTVVVGGATLARVVTMINGYTVTFEDGQYAVNLVGANSNIGDVVNVNQVSIRTANSAGLQDLTSLQAASFKDGQVAINVANGFAGTVFPTGTLGRPSNNVVDAVAIAKGAGMDALYIIGPLTLVSGDDITSFRVTGQNPINSSLALEDGAVLDKADIQECAISGVLDDNCVIRSCLILGLEYVNGYILDSGLTAEPITLGTNSIASLINCYSISTLANETAIIDFSNGNQSLILRGFVGDMTIKGHTVPSGVSLDFDSGHITVDSTCTAGTVSVRGVVGLTDNSGAGCDVVRVDKAVVLADVPVIVDGVWRYER